MALSITHAAPEALSTPLACACRPRERAGPTGLGPARTGPASARSGQQPDTNEHLAFGGRPAACRKRSWQTHGTCPAASSRAPWERRSPSPRPPVTLRSPFSTGRPEMPPAALGNPGLVPSGPCESCGHRPPPVFKCDDSGVLTRASIGRPCSYGRRAAPLSRFRRGYWPGGARPAKAGCWREGTGSETR